MKKYDNFKAALKNLKVIYAYHEPYGTVEITGIVGLYEICFEQAWKAMKEILEINGYAEGATGSPKTILKTAYRAGMIQDEELWLTAQHHPFLVGAAGKKYFMPRLLVLKSRLA